MKEEPLDDIFARIAEKYTMEDVLHIAKMSHDNPSWLLAFGKQDSLELMQVLALGILYGKEFFNE